jgi:predicted DNA-binding protein YlxM (UPF0122 family)
MVAKEYYTSDKSMEQLAKEHHMTRGGIYKWIKRYRSEFVADVNIKRDLSTFGSVINTEPVVKKKKLSPERMEQRILELEAQLKQEQMRSTVLDKMIDLAEQDLKISIRKKSGAKQSS